MPTIAPMRPVFSAVTVTPACRSASRAAIIAIRLKRSIVTRRRRSSRYRVSLDFGADADLHLAQFRGVMVRSPNGRAIASQIDATSRRARICRRCR